MRIAKILASVGIEQALVDAGTSPERNENGLSGVWEVANAADHVAGIRTGRSRFQVCVGQSRSRRTQDDWGALRRCVKLIAVHDDAARQADDEHIEANTDSAIQVNLKHGPAHPHRLRANLPLLPRRQTFIHRGHGVLRVLVSWIRNSVTNIPERVLTYFVAHEGITSKRAQEERRTRG